MDHRPRDEAETRDHRHAGRAARVDRGLLAGVCAREPAAQRAFYLRHQARVSAQILRMTSDPTSVEDLLQEVFIAAFNGVGRFRGESEVDTWMHTIAANKVRNWWESNRRRHRRECFAASPDTGETPTPDRDLEVLEHRARLCRAVGALAPKFRDAFNARVIGGLSLHEASVALGVPVSTVSHRTRRAERILCQALDIEPDPAL